MTLAKVYNMQQARQKQDDPLNLQSLPMVAPLRDGWPVVEAALCAEARRRRLRRLGAAALAVAASVTLALGLYLRAPADPAAGSAGSLAARPHDAQATDPPVTPPRAAAETAAGPATLDSLIALSQQLEARLRAVRAEGGSLPARAVVYQVELEDLVIQVDEEISRQPDSLALWSQRVSLLMDLEQLYENRLRREYQRMASL